MAVIASDSWTGADGAAWSNQWTTGNIYGTAGTATIQSNAGQLTTGTSNTYSWERAYLAAMPALSDTDMTVTVWPQNGVTLHQQIYLTICADDTATSTPPSGYSLTLYFSTNGTVHSQVDRRQGNATKTTVIAYASVTAQSAYKVRFQQVGATIQFKLWASTASEPAAWTGTYTDPTPLPAGRVLFAVANSSDNLNAYATFDDLTILGTAPVVTPQTTITVWDGTTEIAATATIWDGSTEAAVGTLDIS